MSPERHTTDHLLTAAEAQKMFRNAPVRSTFHMHALAHLPTSADQYFESSTYVDLSRKDACRVAASLLERFEERGARLPVRISTTRYTFETFTRTAYWIG